MANARKKLEREQAWVRAQKPETLKLGLYKITKSPNSLSQVQCKPTFF